MNLIFQLLIIIMSFIFSISLFPISLFVKYKIQQSFVKNKNISKEKYLYRLDDLNYNTANLFSGDKIYSYLIITIPTVAIMIRCTYVDINESTYGLFSLTIIASTLIILHVFLYLKIKHFYKSIN